MFFGNYIWQYCSFKINNYLQEYLQRERYGSARLENFASGLELIGQKVWTSHSSVFNILSL